jgi:hypothetical protein
VICPPCTYSLRLDAANALASVTATFNHVDLCVSIATHWLTLSSLLSEGQSPSLVTLISGSSSRVSNPTRCPFIGDKAMPCLAVLHTDQTGIQTQCPGLSATNRRTVGLGWPVSQHVVLVSVALQLHLIGITLYPTFCRLHHAIHVESYRCTASPAPTYWIQLLTSGWYLTGASTEPALST